MVVLRRGESTVETLFAAHPDDENHLSASFAYLLAHSPPFLKRVVGDILPDLAVDLSETEVRIQTSRRGEGITDVELVLSDKGFIVFEAKRGTTLPSISQLKKYATRCKASGAARTQLVALTALRREAAELGLGVNEVAGIPLTARSWEWVRRLVGRAVAEEHGQHARWLLSEYRKYLEDLVGNDRVFSNLVYVVSLGTGTPRGWKVSWIEVVEKHNRYFYPVAKNWPAPPNYLGFRYHGRLQSIRHVTSFSVVPDLRKHFPTTKDAPNPGQQYLLKLGPPIQPRHKVPTGPRVLRNSRVWCMLDALLTCDTISEALTETKRRQKEEPV